MGAFGKIPEEARVFSGPLGQHFVEPAWGHFWPIVMGVIISDVAPIKQGAKTLPGCHRCLWHTPEAQVVRSEAAVQLTQILPHGPARPPILHRGGRQSARDKYGKETTRCFVSKLYHWRLQIDSTFSQGECYLG